MTWTSIYQAYLNKVQRKERSQDELDNILSWLTGYSPQELQEVSDIRTVADFYRESPAWNPAASAVTGIICGVKIQELTDPLMKQIRITDKLVDELAKGRPLEKIRRS
ncbi:DUF2200 family protein [Streptococcus sp. 19428wA2_WM07]|nr:DUF2200 family protein [Streptococcus sp. 19428wA2_WM07]MBF0806490.1 DUF2200 family protein [Streptococcus sp. 19428wA2_WM07]TFU27876.1 DUF2200 family protein [Streptococcus sp. WM07]